jgi:hypothetical protein
VCVFACLLCVSVLYLARLVLCAEVVVLCALDFCKICVRCVFIIYVCRVFCVCWLDRALLRSVCCVQYCAML